jgi:AraC-like DNA-binding protein
MLGGPSYVIPARTRFQKQALELLGALYEPDSFIQLEQRCGWPFPGLREVYRDPKTMAKRPYYSDAEALLRNGRYIEDLPYIRGNYLNWENASSQILDPLFRKDAAAARFEETAENLRLRLSVFLPKPVYSDLVAKAVEGIHRNLSRSLSVQALAKELGVSRSHLIRQFKKGTRMTPLRYLNQARVEKAKELLQYTTFNVSEVSVQVGFKSIFHFSKVFRQISGRNPPASSSSSGTNRAEWTSPQKTKAGQSARPLSFPGSLLVSASCPPCRRPCPGGPSNGGGVRRRWYRRRRSPRSPSRRCSSPRP